MASRKELGNALVECLVDVTSLLEHAHKVALEEQDALVANDAEAIASSCAAQEEVLQRIGQADQRAASVAEQLVDLAGLDPENADDTTIAQAAGPAYAGLISLELVRVSQTSERVRDANEINAKLLENGLDIIATCLRTVANETQPITYSEDAGYSQRLGSVLSLDSKV